jgi:hypothetical protein
MSSFLITLVLIPSPMGKSSKKKNGDPNITARIEPGGDKPRPYKTENFLVYLHIIYYFLWVLFQRTKTKLVGG